MNTESQQQIAREAASKATRDEARAQRDWLIKECARVGVTVNVQIGASITEAYRLVNNDAEVRKPLVELLRSVHTWFMQQAPQHYNGCGLWIDVDYELAKYPRPNCILDVDSPTLPPQREEYLQCGCKNCRDALAKVKQ